MKSRTKALAELWRRGEVADLLFHRGQRRIHQMFQSLSGAVLVFNISRQWGKTFFGVVVAIMWALKHPGSRIRIAAAFESDLTDFIEPAFEVALSTCPLHLRPRYVLHRKRFIFPNGSIIRLVGLDKKPNGLRGNTIDLIVLDEAGFISRLNYLHDSVIVPLTTHRPNARIMLLSTPPESTDHEFWDFVDKAKLEGAYAEFTIDENPMLTPERIAEIERKYVGGRESTAFQREYLCRRVVESQRAIVPEWRQEYEQAFETSQDPLYQYWHKYESLDIGVQIDKTLCLFAHYNFRQSRLYIEHEVDVSAVKTTTRIIGRSIIDKEVKIGWSKVREIPDQRNPNDFVYLYDHDGLYRRIADNSHPLLLNDLSDKGCHFAQTDKAKLHEMVGEVRVWVQSGRVVVHPRCKQLLGCLNSGIWNKQRSEFERSKVFGHYDALAALVYLIRNVDQYTNPIPDSVANPNAWLTRQKPSPLSETGKGIGGLFTRRA